MSEKPCPIIGKKILHCNSNGDVVAELNIICRKKEKRRQSEGDAGEVVKKLYLICKNCLQTNK